jgi:hypothetical protein
VLKIADFGLARHFKKPEHGAEVRDQSADGMSKKPANMTNRVITLWYRSAPLQHAHLPAGLLRPL